MDFKLNLYNLRENRKMKPKTFANLVASSLYEKRFNPPLIVDLDLSLLLPLWPAYQMKAKLWSQPMIPLVAQAIMIIFKLAGLQQISTLIPKIFSIYGACESFFRPDLSPEELEDVLG